MDARFCCGAALLALLPLCPGCGVLGGLPLPEGLGEGLETARFDGTYPPVIAYVLDHADEFAVSDDPLAAVEPGTALDDLAGLSGCWGSYERQDWFQGQLPAFESWEAYHFDAAAGRLVRWVVTANWLFMPGAFSISEETYTIAEGGRLRLQSDRYTIYDLRTGEGRTATPSGAFDELEVRVTLAGDRLLLADPENRPAGRVFRRFACPP